MEAIEILFHSEGLRSKFYLTAVILSPVLAIYLPFGKAHLTAAFCCIFVVLAFAGSLLYEHDPENFEKEERGPSRHELFRDVRICLLVTVLVLAPIGLLYFGTRGDRVFFLLSLVCLLISLVGLIVIWNRSERNRETGEKLHSLRTDLSLTGFAGFFLCVSLFLFLRDQGATVRHLLGGSSAVYLVLTILLGLPEILQFLKE